ncbi:MAG: spore cortex-lytic enzyme [Ruminiclostridium sp.]|nr:spore cortex-lytic enzyme [Ruminiclostridium sp.]
MNSFFRMLLVLTVIVLCAAVAQTSLPEEALPAYSRTGSSGTEVEEIQRVLKERGLFNGEITGYYGEQTRQAVTKFQRQQGLKQSGIADEATLKRLGITIGVVPEATDANINLLARIISAEGRGESYVGQVAIGAVICNRIEHPSFPDTLAGVIYQNGAFTALSDGQFNQPVTESAYSAARDALAGWDPTGGAIYYYNPAKTSNRFIYSRPVIAVIGDHRFCS